MAGARMRVAKLDKDRLAKLRALEKQMGCCIVALEPEFRLAELSRAQIKGLQAAEKDLGVVLLAYELE